MSSFLVKTGNLIKIMDRVDNCIQLCKCGPNNYLIECQRVCNTNIGNDCKVNEENVKHLKQFNANDKHCLCFNSNIQCNDR